MLTEVCGALRIVWVARVSKEKRILEFLQGVRIAAERVALEVTVIGEGQQLKAARKEARGLPVKFTGRLSRDLVSEQMKDAHLTALTSYGFDNQPVTIVESIHARRPVILCDTRLTEGLKGVGFYTRTPEARSIAETLVTLAQHRERIIAASEQTVMNGAEFEPSTHVSKLRNIYRTVQGR